MRLIGTTLFAAATLFSAASQAEPVSYVIEPSHTYPSFKAPHMGISFWRGKFNTSSGKVVLDKEAQSGSIEINIDAASVDFGHNKMNEHARNEDFFNVETFPSITYKGDIEFGEDGPVAVNGELILLGVSKPVRLDIHSFKCITHPFFKKEVCGADATGSFNRADFGMTKYADGEAGQVWLEVQVEALRN